MSSTNRQALEGFIFDPSTGTIYPMSPPIITFFRALESQVYINDDVTLSWSTLYATQVTLNGEPVPNRGSRKFSVRESREFSLVARNEFGQDEKTVAVIATPRPPRIFAFFARPQNSDGFTPMRIAWRVGDVEEVYLNNERVEPRGSVSLVIEEPRQFRLIAHREGIVSEQTLTVSVTPASPVIYRFEPVNYFYCEGDEIELIWDVRHAETIAIDAIVGENLVDKKSVRIPAGPPGCKIFTLIANNRYEKEVVATCEVQVLQSPMARDLGRIMPCHRDASRSRHHGGGTPKGTQTKISLKGERNDNHPA